MGQNRFFKTIFSDKRRKKGNKERSVFKERKHSVFKKTASRLLQHERQSEMKQACSFHSAVEAAHGLLAAADG